jgi:hypothetical protein
MTFPLFERAVERGVLEGQSALAFKYCRAQRDAGKSFIGCEIIRSAPIKIRQEKARGPHAYFVPFRSLAGEVLCSFERRPKPLTPAARVRRLVQ